MSPTAAFFLRKRRITAHEKALVDGGFGDQFLVELTITVDSVQIGADRGTVWFADGLMGFSGLASSFVLAASDIEVRRYGRDHPRAGAPYPPASIVLSGAPREAYVTINPLGKDAEEYRSRLERFEEETSPTETERFWPPLHPYSAPLEAATQAVSR